MAAAGASVLSWGEALCYGVIQGLTEFLPVSSSGHLVIAHLLGLGRVPGHLAQAFDVLLHAATLLAIVIAFRREILMLLRWHSRLYLCLTISVVPAGLAGLFGQEVVDWFRGSWLLLGVAYLGTALLLFAGHGLERRRGTEVAEEPPPDPRAVRPAQAALVGALQIFAILPGISRSGSTVAAGLIGGMSPALAVAWSFLAGLPLIAAAAAKDAIGGGFGALLAQTGAGPLIVAFLASLLVGLASIAALRLVVRRRGLPWFAAYCTLVALICFAVELA